MGALKRTRAKGLPRAAGSGRSGPVRVGAAVGSRATAPSQAPVRASGPAARARTVAIVTGTRAEFGLLRPVIDAVRKHKRLRLRLIAAGAHFLPPAHTVREVKAAYPIAAEVRMQRPGKTGRAEDAEALGRGVAGFARAFAKLRPDWVVVLGDRVEAFAAASAASVAGIAVCHIHGGDRAEGIADEAMRHAITKLSHMHCAATRLSAQRIVKMGERPEHVHVTGSPAIDGLDKIKPMGDAEAKTLGDPEVVLLMHPSGLKPEWEVCALHHACILARSPRGLSARTLALSPNTDAGRDAIQDRLDGLAATDAGITLKSHLERHRFIALLKRLAARPTGALIGNSSAGLIECASLGLPVINLGPRQNGRECAANVRNLLNEADVYGRQDFGVLCDRAMTVARAHVRSSLARRPSRLFGDGRAGPRIAALLASVDPHDPGLLRKRNVY